MTTILTLLLIIAVGFIAYLLFILSQAADIVREQDDELKAQRARGDMLSKALKEALHDDYN